MKTLLKFFLNCLIALPCCLFADSVDQITDNYLQAAEQPGAVIFTPPEGWRLSDPSQLPKSVKAMVVGKGKHELPPSINLGMHSYEGSLQDYLKMVKNLNHNDRVEWKDLGTIRTQAGVASLSQLDMKSKWGDIREMQVILHKEGTVYILTAAAIKDEFPKFYNDFFTAMRSLRFNNDQEGHERS